MLDVEVQDNGSFKLDTSVETITLTGRMCCRIRVGSEEWVEVCRSFDTRERRVQGRGVDLMQICNREL
jgi:hypothetical protein